MICVRKLTLLRLNSSLVNQLRPYQDSNRPTHKKFVPRKNDNAGGFSRKNENLAGYIRKKENPGEDFSGRNTNPGGFYRKNENYEGFSPKNEKVGGYFRKKENSGFSGTDEKPYSFSRKNENPGGFSKLKPSYKKDKGTINVNSVTETLRNLPVLGSDEDNEREIDVHPLLRSKPFEPSEDPPLLQLLTPEFKHEIVGNATMNIFKFDKIKRMLKMLHSIQFPLPDTLTMEQWRQLLKYDSSRARQMYLNALHYGKDQDPETLKELDKVDAEAFAPLSVDPAMLEKLIDNDPQKQEIWNDVCHVFEKAQMHGMELCPYLEEKEVITLLDCNTVMKRKAALKYISNNQKSDLKREAEKLANIVVGERVSAQRSKELATDEVMKPYTLGGNVIMIRFGDTRMDNIGRLRQIQLLPSETSRQLIIDLSHVKTMNYKEKKSLFFRELQYSVAYNRDCFQPFNLTFVNMYPEIEPMMDKGLGGIISRNHDRPESVTDKCYMDLFPHDKLVYLSPDSRHDLDYDPDDIYIIGGLVDPITNNGYSIGQAKKHKIRHAKLPLKKIVGFDAVLNVEHVVAIMADFCATKDWFYACRWIPPRLFRNILKSAPFTVKQEYVYLTHKKLHPTEGYLSPNGQLQPTLYKRLFSKYLSLAPDTLELQDPMKYNRISQKTRRDRFYGDDA